MVIRYFNRGVISLIMISLLFLTTSCASLFGRASMLSIATEPENAQIIIQSTTNLAEKMIKKSPCTVYLNKGSDYIVTVKLKGYTSEEIPIRRTISGWFWGNLLLGGIIGMIVDGTTGNMYEHTPTVIGFDLEKETSALPDSFEVRFPVSLILEDGSRKIQDVPIRFYRDKV